MTVEQIEELEARAASYQTKERLTFKIFSFSDNVLTVEVKQEKTPDGRYLDRRQLVARVKNLFSLSVPAIEVHARPVPHMAPEVDQVTPEWVKKQMFEKGVKMRTIGTVTGIDKTKLSAWINGLRPMSQAVKAMFYFYFKAH